MNILGSRGSFQIRFSLFDVLWAASSPIVALALRDVVDAHGYSLATAAIYCLISFSLSLLAFLIFRIRDGIAHHFSVADALKVGKAVAVSELLTTVVLFTAMREEGIPRTVPIIHALILATGLVSYRAIIRLRHDNKAQPILPPQHPIEHIIMIGCTRLSTLYMKIMHAYTTQPRKVIGFLDEDPKMTGRSVGGAHVLGHPSQLDSVIREFAEHGIAVNRVIIGGDRGMVSEEEMFEIERVCAARNLKVDFVPLLVGITTLMDPVGEEITPTNSAATIELPAYFRFKRIADIIFGLAVLIIFSPLMLLIAAVVLFDVGSPVLFWQQRIGVGGSPFLLYKFRTLKPLFSPQGFPIGESDRISSLGWLVRRLRFDELPQLLSVLVGDMSLIGPRPLLPHDQPPDAELRLTVRPGITGWAQVNGGKSISAEKKKKLDEWYIRNASFGLDLRILIMTVRFIVTGERSIVTNERAAEEPESTPVPAVATNRIGIE